ncbi:hypothetical protein [Shimia sediminis]|uniref:hypothetical protein n=1 Tax=Shimia sediminis TaxID=2497945 RepID=UPI000F8D257C|nr:hypothetical protein [Shimia sediminis]
MTLFSLHYDRGGMSVPEVGRLARQLVLEYPDYPDHWLNYATLVSAQGEASCAHALIVMGTHFSRDGKQHLDSYIDAFKAQDPEPETLVTRLEATHQSHPVLARGSACKQRGLFPRCFDQSRVLEQMETRVDDSSCLRYFP